MLVNDLMAKMNISKYRLAKESGVPYTTVADICSGRAQLGKCSAETIYKLAKQLDVSMEELVEPYIASRISFELFKSNVCHQVKLIGDVAYIVYILENDLIRKYYQRAWYPESLYLLAMLDYLSRINDVPICTRYNDLRNLRLSEVIYPSSVISAAFVADDLEVKKRAVLDSIPEFIRFNIVENEVRNVV